MIALRIIASIGLVIGFFIVVLIARRLFEQIRYWWFTHDDKRIVIAVNKVFDVIGTIMALFLVFSIPVLLVGTAYLLLFC